MEAFARPRYPSWDGLEEEERSDLDTIIRDIRNTIDDIQKKQNSKRPPAALQKKLEEHTSRLVQLTRSWQERPFPSTSAHQVPNDQDRTKFRRIYNLVRGGLQNPVLARDPEFVKALREACQQHGIGSVDPVADGQVAGDQEEVVRGGAHILSDRESILAEAARITFSPPPSFEDVAEAVRIEGQATDIGKDLERDMIIDDDVLQLVEEAAKRHHVAGLEDEKEAGVAEDINEEEEHEDEEENYEDEEDDYEDEDDDNDEDDDDDEDD